MPSPNCALSSNSELAQAGPRPVSGLTVYGLDGAEPPQMLLQPVALATTMRSPNICVSSLTYLCGWVGVGGWGGTAHRHG
jgi:hypothetical protein